MSSQRLRVDLAGRAYDIVVGTGVLASAGQEITKLRKTRRTFIVTDENVAAHHLATLETSLSAASVSHATVILPPGEATKSFAMLQRVVSRMLDEKLERSDLVLALGGGVIGDLAGFAAGIAKRGIDYVQLPTTLLSQVDSSVGGKTAIDTPQGKNLVGVFHQPVLVLADTHALETLPPRELRAGYAEILKYGLISDEAFATWLTANASAILTTPGAERTRAIVTSCSMKARVVEADERETGQRALLNLGHTFGHAIETCLDYSGSILHGEAVAIGMRQAFDFSAKLGLCAAAQAARVAAHLDALGLPTRLDTQRGFAAQTLIDHMGHDKKVRDGKLTFILARGFGKAFVANDVDTSALRGFMTAEAGR